MFLFSGGNSKAMASKNVKEENKSEDVNLEKKVSGTAIASTVLNKETDEKCTGKLIKGVLEIGE